MKYGKIVRNMATKPGDGLIKKSNFGSYHVLRQSFPAKLIIALGLGPLGTLAKGSDELSFVRSRSLTNRPTSR